MNSLDIARLILISVSKNGKIHKNALGYVAKEVVSLDEATVDKLGFDPDQIRRICEAHRTGDCEGATSLLTPEIVSTFIAAGSQEECLKFVESVVEAGVNLPILVPFGGDVHPIIEVGEEFAKKA